MNLDSLNVLGVEQAKTAFRAWRALQQPLLFIEPDGVNAQLNSKIHFGVDSRVKWAQ